MQDVYLAYNAGGSVTSIVDALNSGQRQCFGYDWLDRLTRAFTGDGDCSAYSAAGTGPYEHDYSYDPIGNISSFDGASYTYGGSQPHAVTAAHGNSYGYDAAGNQTGRTIDSTTYTLVYDYESRLTAVQENSNVLAEFIYDADGARVLKSDAGGLTVYLDGLYEYALPAAAETVMGEVGFIPDALTHADTTVVLGRSYNNPVVFAQPISQDELDVAVVRITDIQADRFTLHVDEAPNHDGAHTTEAVSYIVLEAGSWELADGTLLEVGSVQTAATVGSALSDQWEPIVFSQAFTAAPAVLSQVQTDNDPHWAKTRQQIATTTGVNIALEEEEGKSTPHGTETVGWLAIEPGAGNWSGRLFEVGLTADAVTHSWYSFSFGQSFSAAPRFLAGLASYDSDESAHLRYRRAQLTAAGAQVRVEEDSVFDSEYGHTTETAAYLAIEGSGELSATGGTSGPASTTYYETQGGALAMRRAGYPADNGIFYILSDHLGSSSVILAQDGTVVKRDYYYPYGGNRGTPYTDITTKRFTGQYHEAGLPGGEGLSFYNARWYDPQLGRFVSADSIVPEPGRPQSFNRYSYVLNSPLKYRDPSGHRTCTAQQAATGDETCNQNITPSSSYVTPGRPSRFNSCGEVWCQVRPVRPRGISNGTWNTYHKLWWRLMQEDSPYLTSHGRIDDQYLVAILIHLELKDARGRAYNAALEAVSYHYHGWACAGGCSSLAQQLRWMDSMESWRERTQAIPETLCDFCWQSASQAIAGYDDGDAYQAVWWGNPFRGSELHQYISDNYPQPVYKTGALMVDGSRFIVGIRGNDDRTSPLTLSFVVLTSDQLRSCYSSRPNCMGFTLP